MLHVAKNIIYFIFYWLRNALNPVFDFQEVSVLCYHSVSKDSWHLSVAPEIFEKQIEFLKKNYYIATLDEIASFVKGERDLPRRTVAITFDDGYEDNFTNAFPILQKYNIPATIFLLSGSDTEEARKNLGIWFQMLNQHQIEEMKATGLIDFQFHSRTHNLLNTLSEEKLEKEVKREDSFSYFAYPRGRYSEEVIEALKREGYKGAFSVHAGLVKKGDNLFLIKRNIIVKDTSFLEFKLKLVKAIDWLVMPYRFYKNLLFSGKMV